MKKNQKDTNTKFFFLNTQNTQTHTYASQVLSNNYFFVCQTNKKKSEMEENLSKQINK